jgi:hypothetical protein
VDHIVDRSVYLGQRGDYFHKKLMKLTETSTSRVLDAPEFQFEKGEFNLDVRSGNCLQICLINFPRWKLSDYFRFAVIADDKQTWRFTPSRFFRKEVCAPYIEPVRDRLSLIDNELLSLHADWSVPVAIDDWLSPWNSQSL